MPPAVTRPRSGLPGTIPQLVAIDGSAAQSTVFDHGFATGGPLAANAASVALGGPGNDTTSSAPVPSGTYFVRIRAANAFGVSAPTNEVSVVVP